MNSDPYLIAVGIIGKRELTDALLNDVISMLPKIIPDIEAEVLDKIRKQLEATIGVSMVTGQGIIDEKQEPWLEDAKSSIQWTYWNAYTNELKSTGFSQNVVRVLDEDTDNILDACGNANTSSAWRMQGLVMGDVQSGKTASYCGLINKAADVGYKFIVLLTGMIEDLRSQSQERMDSGFVGRDSRKILSNDREKKAIGSGRFRTVFPNVLTSVDSDFLTANEKFMRGIPLENINAPVLLVMKKNKSPLENLIGFLESQIKGRGPLNLPLLLIDDEADNASVNSKKDEDPTTINKLIREVLKRFTKSTYVAYTATPFANVFINPDGGDLFPSDFVYSLNTPSNYIGAGSIFSDAGNHQYQKQDILDAVPAFPYAHKKEWQVPALPPSLEEALQTFLISCAIRDLRGEPLRHRSMLINVTRFTDVQDRIAILVKDYIYVLTEEIKQYLAADTAWHKHARLMQLHETWEAQYADCDHSWDEIRKSLYDSVASLKVLTVNQKSEAGDRLNFGAYKNAEKGRRVIAIGGLTLSRGLTLEGLCVSYFYRNSKAYDTLLQMGRWFGYRPGYDDLCRVWMDPNVQDWFGHVADVISELKLDIRRMHANRYKPIDFGIRVRSHPDSLIVTALNKMRNTKNVEVDVSYSTAGAETAFLPGDEQVNRKNLKHAIEFVGGLGHAERIGSRCVWKRKTAAEVANFLNGLNISLMNMPFTTDITGRDRPIISFIRNNQIAALKEWDVCLSQGSGEEIPEFSVVDSDGNHRCVRPRKRQFEKVPVGSDYLKLNKQRVGDITDEMVDLSKPKIEIAKQEWAEEVERDPGKGKTVPGFMYRRYRDRPLLTIHIIEPSDPEEPSEAANAAQVRESDEAVDSGKAADAKKSRAAKKDRVMKSSDIKPRLLVAVGLSFPKYEDRDEASRVPYRLNKVALRNMGLIDAEDGDDDGDD
ncbi:hypothetical protein PTE30175_01345 [Pandoraea terrae]|uniref:Putative endonuclease Z1 domain-containing protein n=1 Tax=Pandoraea terrae TaxID=1537710 RepID=A0A5E4THN9_9BURK|nr:Z1 domain-containing protein [Pandoraea terrae]VVD86782.1 hypothetical protein PTE30175_01345 [Pandoraea terrae]